MMFLSLSISTLFLNYFPPCFLCVYFDNKFENHRLGEKSKIRLERHSSVVKM